MSAYRNSVEDAALPALEYPSNGSNSGDSGNVLGQILNSVTSIVASIFGRNNQATTQQAPVYIPTVQSSGTGLNTTTLLIILAVAAVLFFSMQGGRRRR